MSEEHESVEMWLISEKEAIFKRIAALEGTNNMSEEYNTTGSPMISLTKADWESTQSKLAILEQQLAQLTSNFNQFINMVIPDANLPMLEEEKPDGVMKQ